jgi:hypothetical protein
VAAGSTDVNVAGPRARWPRGPSRSCRRTAGTRPGWA